MATSPEPQRCFGPCPGCHLLVLERRWIHATTEDQGRYEDVRPRQEPLTGVPHQCGGMAEPSTTTGDPARRMDQLTQKGP